MARKARTAAQRAATRKMIAANRKRGGRKATRRKVKRNPTRRATARRPAARRRVSRAVRRNPAPRRRRRTAAAAPVRRRRRSVRRNPIGLDLKRIRTNLLLPALNGVAGSIVVDGVYGYLPVPDSMRVGYGRHAVKAGLALALAMLGSRVFRPATAISMGVGSLTVTGHEIARELAAQFAPDLALDGQSMSVGAFITGAGATPNQGMGAFITGAGASPRLGYTSSAMQVSPEGGSMQRAGSGAESAHYSGGAY